MDASPTIAVQRAGKMICTAVEGIILRPVANIYDRPDRIRKGDKIFLAFMGSAHE